MSFIPILFQPGKVKAATNLLSNPDLESWTSPHVLSNWGWSDGGGANAYMQEVSQVFSGNYSVRLYKDNDLSTRGIFTQSFTLSMFTYYTLSIWVLDNNPHAKIGIYLDISGPNQYIASTNNAEWQLLSVTVESDIQTFADVEIRIEDEGITPGGTCVIDGAGFVEGTTPLDIVSPQITITSPSNTSYASSDIWLNYTLDESSSWVGYSLDDTPNTTILSNTLLKSLSVGTHYLVVYANDSEGNMGSSTKWFTIDTLAPEITILYPGNTTYNTDTLSLAVILNEPCPWMAYSLDGADNITMTGNLIIEGLEVGAHSITVYVNDSVGNVGSSSIGFTIIEVPYTSKIYETTWVTQSKNTAEFTTLSLFAGIIGIFLLRKKRK